MLISSWISVLAFYVTSQACILCAHIILHGTIKLLWNPSGFFYPTYLGIKLNSLIVMIPILKKKIKDTRDVPQFKIISYKSLFLIYFHLNLLMPINQDTLPDYFWVKNILDVLYIICYCIQSAIEFL